MTPEDKLPPRSSMPCDPSPADEGRLLLPLLPECVACGLWCDHSGPAAPPRWPSGVDFPTCALQALPADLWANPSG